MASEQRLSTLYWELEVRMARAKAEAEALATGQAAGQAFDRGADLESAGRKGAQQWVTSLISDLGKRREELKAAAVAGLLTPQEAAQQGRQVAAQFTRELMGGLRALREQGVIGVGDFAGLFEQGSSALRLNRIEAERLAEQLVKTGSVYESLGRNVYVQAYAMDAAFNKAKSGSAIYDNLSRAVYAEAYAMDAGRGAHTRHVAGLGRVTQALEGVIHRATETSPVLARLGTSLLEFGVGAAVTLAVVGGLALIVTAYQKLTQSAREAKETIDKVIDSLRAQADAEFRASRAGKEAASDAALLAELQAQARLNRARAGSLVFDPSLGGNRTVVDLKEVARAEEELADARRIREHADSKLVQTEESRAAALGRALQAGKASNALTQEATELTKKYNAELTALLSSDKTDEATLDRINLLKGMVDDLTAADRQAEKAGKSAADAAQRLREAQESARSAFASATARLTAGKEDDFDTQLSKLTAQAVKAKLSADEIRKLVADLRAAHVESVRRSQEALQQEVAELGVRSTVTAVDDLELALEKLKKSMREKGASQELIDQVTAIQQPIIDATARSEKLAGNIERIQRDLQAGFNLKQDLADIESQIDAAIEARNKATPGSQAQAQAQKDLDRLLALEVELREKIRALNQASAAHVQTTRQATASLAGDIANAANAAFGLASAFLGVNANITKALGSIGQLAGGIQSALNAATLSKALPGIGQAIGGGLALISSLTGQSAEEKARQERIRENTEALRKLTDRVGTLAQINATGSDIVAAMAALSSQGLTDEALRARLQSRLGSSFADLARNPAALGAATDRERRRVLDDAIRAQGLSVEEFNDALRGLGITLDSTKITAADLDAAIHAVNEAALVKFGASFAGQMEEFNAAIAVFPDLENPIKQFDEFRKALDRVKNGGGELSKILAGFDLSTAEGIAAAEKALQELFTKFQEGTLTAADLGGLTPAEFVTAILKGLDIVHAAAEDAGAAGTGGFNVSRQITEVTGNRIAALLSTGNIFNEQTARNTALIAQLLGGGPTPGPVTPPRIEPTGFGPGSAPVVYITIENDFSGSVADPEQVGTKIGDAALRAIDKGLGGRAKWVRRSLGDVSRN